MAEETAITVERRSSAPFLSVAQTFSCEFIGIVYNPELPTVNCDHGSDIQHVSCDLFIAAALQESFTIFDVILHCIAVM